MAENRRMTYEEQRALRAQQRSSTADRLSVDNYSSGGRARTYSDRQRNRPESTSDQRQSQRASNRQRTTSSQRPTRQSSTRRPSERASATSTRSTSGRASRQSASRQGASRQGASRQGASRQGSARSRSARQTTRSSFSRSNYGGEATARSLPIRKIAIAVILLVAIVLGVNLCSVISPITVTVNGTSYELRGAKSMEDAIKQSGLPINPGDLISLNGNILEKSKGQPFLATVNNEQTADPNYRLRDGDSITLTDGEDIVEDYDSTEQSIPFAGSITGSGAIHKFEPGTEGVLETRTGRISGETVEKQTTAPVNATAASYNLNSGNQKSIAITFDDGPSSEYTAAVLDILKQNDVKATFFVIGTNVEEYPDLVRREYDEGHQICTHSYDHADPVGGTSLTFMDANGQVNEIERGKKTIADATGIEDVSTVVRFPGGNYDEAMVMNLVPYVSYDIGWNIDTEDWTLPGVEAIYNQIVSAKPGDVILCHDGGGDRSETVEALKRAIPDLKSKGFTFLTMDEMLEYPAANA